MSGAGLVDLSDASHFHDRGFLLPLCKACGLLTIRVDATEGFAITIKNGNLPVMVLSPPVFPECCGFLSFHLRNTITLRSLEPSSSFRKRVFVQGGRYLSWSGILFRLLFSLTV